MHDTNIDAHKENRNQNSENKHRRYVLRSETQSDLRRLKFEGRLRKGKNERRIGEGSRLYRGICELGFYPSDKQTGHFGGAAHCFFLWALNGILGFSMGFNKIILVQLLLGPVIKFNGLAQHNKCLNSDIVFKEERLD